ncbi:MAG: guanylate kinase [Bacteroidia bacterium]|nr:guanylate kinase [Bacteroidia bacterium]
MAQASGHILILSAPSGAGKTTLAGKVLSRFSQFEFSVSATTRAPRHYEEHGKHYYFLDQEEFEELLEQDAFIEWEEVYPGRYYGTLRSEIDRILAHHHFPVLDIDVDGGVHVKRDYGDRAVSVFIQPPSIEALEQRLRNRKADSEEDIQQRLKKAAHELEYAQHYDFVVINDDLERAADELEGIIRQMFLVRS